MKKNLNIAYLNGAEGMIRRGGASSGESGGGSNSGDSGSSGDSKIVYTDINKASGGIFEAFLMFAIEVATKDGGFVTAFQVGQILTNDITWVQNNANKMAVSTESRFDAGGTYYTLEEMFSLQGLDYRQYTITKEEYYAV